jgi:hypothetical protein
MISKVNEKTIKTVVMEHEKSPQTLTMKIKKSVDSMGAVKFYVNTKTELSNDIRENSFMFCKKIADDFKTAYSFLKCEINEASRHGWLLKEETSGKTFAEIFFNE